MAGAVQDLANFDAALKDKFDGAVRTTLNSEVRLLRRLMEGDVDWSGRRCVMDINIGRNASSGARGDNEPLPDAGAQEHRNAYIWSKYNYGRISVSGPTIAASRDRMGAFTKVVASETKGAVRDLKVEMNYQMFNDGSGARARVNTTVVTGTILTIDSPHGIAYPVITRLNATRCLRRNMKIVFGSQRWNPTIRTLNGTSTRKILALDPVNNTITLDAALVTTGGISDNDFIYQEYGYAATDSTAADNCQLSREVTGLLGIVDQNTFLENLQGISRNSYATEWGAAIIGAYATNSSIGIDGDIMQMACDDANERGSGDIDLIFSHHSVRREYLKDLTRDVRFEPYQLKGGFKEDTRENRGEGTSLMFNDIPVWFEKDCPYGTMFFIDRSSVKVYKQRDFGFDDTDGRVLNKIAGYDAFEAFIKVYLNLGSEAPNRNAVIRGINHRFTP